MTVDSTSAELMSKEGKKYKVALTTLSDADQKVCLDWLAANPQIKLTVKAEGFTAKGTRQTNNAASGGGGTSTVSRTRTLQEGYHISVSNWSKDPAAKLSGLKVSYVIVVGFSNTAGDDKRGVKQVVKGSVDVPELTGSKGQIVDTKTVSTGQSAAVSSRTTTGSSSNSSTSTSAAVYRESMDGICLVIKAGERVVATYTTGKVPKEVQIELMK